MNIMFLIPKYKQFDGEREHCNFSCNIGMLQTRAFKGPVTLRNFLSNLSRNGWKFSVASCRGLVLRPCYTV